MNKLLSKVEDGAIKFFEDLGLIDETPIQKTPKKAKLIKA
jgi:hypothetical protein